MNTLKLKLQQVWRQRRMSVFLMKMAVKNGYKIIDLGGTPHLWEMIDLDLEITLLNLSPVIKLNDHPQSGWLISMSPSKGLTQ